MSHDKIFDTQHDGVTNVGYPWWMAGAGGGCGLGGCQVLAGEINIFVICVS